MLWLASSTAISYSAKLGAGVSYKQETTVAHQSLCALNILDLQSRKLEEEKTLRVVSLQSEMKRSFETLQLSKWWLIIILKPS